jgi:hypothetical protein
VSSNAGLQACSALDALATILALGNAPLLSAGLQAVLNCKQLSTSDAQASQQLPSCSRAEASSESLWTTVTSDETMKQAHYLDAGNGSFVSELRFRFNRCVRSLVETVKREISNRQSPLCAPALELLGCKMDSVDIDFLSVCAVDALFDAMCCSIRSEFERAATLQLLFLDKFSAYCRFLVFLVRSLHGLGESANPVFVKTAMDGVHTSMQTVLTIACTTASLESVKHLNQFLGLLMLSIRQSLGSTRIAASLSSAQWQDLLWHVATSKATQGVRLDSLLVIRSLFRSRFGWSEMWIGRALALVHSSSPEKFASISDATAGDTNLAVRGEAVSLLSFIADSPEARPQVMQVLAEALDTPAASPTFLAAVLTCGGRLDCRARRQQLANKEVAAGGRFRADEQGGGMVLADEVVCRLVRSSILLLEHVLAVGEAAQPDTSNLAVLVAGARAVKALWELFPLHQEVVKSPALLQLLAKLAVEPCPVPFSYVPEPSVFDGKSSDLWTWGPSESTNMVITNDGLTVRNKSGRLPDYSCSLGSETFAPPGVYVWELEVTDVQAMWLGIGRGIEEAGGLRRSPGNCGEFLLCFGSKGGGVSHGLNPTIESLSPTRGFSSGAKVRFELDCSERTLGMWADGVARYMCSNVDCETGVVPYLCTDNCESATILYRKSSAAGHCSSLTLDMLAAKVHAVLPLQRESGLTSLKTFLKEVDGLTGPQAIETLLQKLQDSCVTVDELISPSMTKDRLKALGIPFGQMSAIFHLRDAYLAEAAARSKLAQARHLARNGGRLLPLSSCLEALSALSESAPLQGAIEELHRSVTGSASGEASIQERFRHVTADAFVQRGMPRVPSQPKTQKASPRAVATAKAKAGGAATLSDKVVAWTTRGSCVYLALDAERALLVVFARLLLFDVLGTGEHAGMDAAALEQLLVRCFCGVEHARPRALSAELSQDVMEAAMHRAVAGWIRAAPPGEAAKLSGVFLSALLHFADKARRVSPAAIGGTGHDATAGGKQVPLALAGGGGTQDRQYTASEEEEAQGGMGCALMLLSSFAETGLPIRDLTETLAKAMLLAPADSCATLLSSAGHALRRGESFGFVMGDSMRAAMQLVRDAVVKMIQAEQLHLTEGKLFTLHVQNLLDAVAGLELLSADCFDETGKLNWSFSGQVIVLRNDILQAS